MPSGEPMLRIPTEAREVFDVSGAGDTVVAALAYKLGVGASMEDASRFANVAAGLVVGKIGTATVTKEEIQFFQAHGHNEIDRKIRSRNEIASLAAFLKENGKKIVFTNGCFDILHAGHVRLLAQAAAFGDVLIVGLNTDRSVGELKGSGRPINNEHDRSAMLAGLQSVDFVCLFDESTPLELIELIQPDVLVKGGDYNPEDVVGGEMVIAWGGSVEIVELLEGRSTSNTIERLRAEGTSVAAEREGGS